MLASHASVLVSEVLEAMELRPGDVVVDATIGLAGHAEQMAGRIAPGGTLVGFDWDSEMLAIAQEKMKGAKGVTVHTFRANYRACAAELTNLGLCGKVRAMLFDLGLNNAQIEDRSRGISFQEDAPLDMRMDRTVGEPASAWLNRATSAEIDRALREYGGEQWSRRIAQVVVDRRKIKPIATTLDFVDCIAAAVPPSKRDKRIHFATRSFQGVRIQVSGELDGLQECLEEAANCLAPDGRLVALSYHSGEDRAVKHAFRHLAEISEFEVVTRKPIVPTEAEVRANPKSRSAKMRVLRRTA